MTNDDLKQAVFGSGDGATTTLGIIGLTWFAGHSAAIAPAVVGGAIASTVGMGGNEYLSDEDSSIHRAGVMALATLIGSLLPGVPFFIGHSSVALGASAAFALVLGAVITAVRARTTGWSRAVLEVYAVFVLVSVLTVIAGLIFPTNS